MVLAHDQDKHNQDKDDSDVKNLLDESEALELVEFDPSVRAHGNHPSQCRVSYYREEF